MRRISGRNLWGSKVGGRWGEDGEVDESEEQLDDEFNPYAADARRDRLKRKKKKRLNINAGEATLNPNKPPAKLTATLLERFVRIFVMLSQVANTADDLVDYLLTGHHYAQRMLTSAIIAAYTIPQEEKYEMMRQGITPPPLPVLPGYGAGCIVLSSEGEYSHQKGGRGYHVGKNR
ncbi:hypothetical protein CEUSTIGMA_g8997.t1 [Chlamydomonas eustigma]|uniref:Uncharacterized protein n=1 Tax=Chlamydomonas eustigma TaxID=1157962 RepID=A0A250XF74_9CHLO|nr:hypothetical protein CEUSTIGMA_g8997.t1 [Chlamydomonas eustigma]|eukprot:GAX81569.1 hypothetical protein CEUSTIGMA_g8997.t1 [Chlamydomonas eustigma]